MPLAISTYWLRWEITRPSGSFSLVKRRHSLWFGPRSTIWNSCEPGAGSWTCPSATQQGRRSNINHERVFIFVLHGFRVVAPVASVLIDSWLGGAAQSGHHNHKRWEQAYHETELASVSTPEISCRIILTRL